ncbi:hypothetical protein JCM33374_g4333 [Metschnikowia sp. JCM 33374]|nr:hypothetical protein JCM33374_g4333 [Metschnikowia sp. JCM 33374]
MGKKAIVIKKLPHLVRALRSKTKSACPNQFKSKCTQSSLMEDFFNPTGDPSKSNVSFQNAHYWSDSTKVPLTRYSPHPEDRNQSLIFHDMTGWRYQ